MATTRQTLAALAEVDSAVDLRLVMTIYPVEAIRVASDRFPQHVTLEPSDEETVVRIVFDSSRPAREQLSDILAALLDAAVAHR